MERRICVETRNATTELVDGIHNLLREVVMTGGAIGYSQPPSRDEVAIWLNSLLDTVHRGHSCFFVSLYDETVVGMGHWRRRTEPYLAHSAEVEKVMVLPTCQGRGIGKEIVQRLIQSASKTDLEMLSLSVRGNNHAAIELYQHLGFAEWGRQPNVIEVDNERFDNVRMSLRLCSPSAVVFRGSQPVGPGASTGRELGTYPSPDPRNLLDGLRQDSEQVTYDTEVSDPENGCVGILVHGNDNL